MAGYAAVALFIGTVAFVYLYLTPLQNRIAHLQEEAQALRDKSKSKLSGKKNNNPAEQLAEFYRFFPKEDSAPDAMAIVFQAAAQQNLMLDQAEYHQAHDRDSKLMRYEIVLPIKGSYIQVRKFIAQALADVPNLSLDSMTFSRQKIGDSSVDAQLRFTLYLARP